MMFGKPGFAGVRKPAAGRTAVLKRADGSRRCCRSSRAIQVRSGALRVTLCLTMWGIFSGLSGSANAAVAARASRPNIVLILADDLGAHDLACCGADLHETPHLDRLAAEGLQFRQAYAMSVCSPSRAALLTGRHAARLHITIWAEGSRQGPTQRRLLQAESLHDLPLSETTLAEQLRERGYVTALVGKWHLGDAGHFPETQGFDVNVGGNHWGAPQTYWWPYRGSRRYGGEFRYVPHLEFGQPGEYLTDRLTDEAIRVIDQAGERPFFLYLAHFAPHSPIEAKPEDVAYFQSRLRPDMHHQNPIYAAMIRSLDQSVGRVLDHLRQQGLAENTIVIFTSDNGGSLGVDRLSGQTVPATSNAPLRSGKGSLYEGGIRVPLIVRWPGVTQPAMQCSEPVVLMDLFATLCRAAGEPLATSADAVDQSTGPLDNISDGLDLTALLQNPEGTLPRDALFFHYPHYYETTTPVSAVRVRSWKLLEYLEDGELQLFDLQTDPGETTDVSRTHPDLAESLRQRLHQWRQSVGAAMPTANPGVRQP